MSKNVDNFYIGWDDNQQSKTNPAVRFFLVVLFFLTIIVSSCLVISQKGFDDSHFELGSLTEIEGVISRYPVPRLIVQQDEGIKSVLLLGFGKFSAIKDFDRIEASGDISLEGKRVRLKGTRIYYRDKELLELTLGEDSFVHIGSSDEPHDPAKVDYGEVSIKGEIYDPKCALGVMKPGYGKPHRSCAIRCISGGIPPVLHSISPDDGQSYYFIVKGKDGEPVNDLILDYVADQVKICGRLEAVDDWLVIYTAVDGDIQRLAPHWMGGEPLTLCSNEKG